MIKRKETSPRLFVYNLNSISKAYFENTCTHSFSEYAEETSKYGILPIEQHLTRSPVGGTILQWVFYVTRARIEGRPTHFTLFRNHALSSTTKERKKP